LGTAAVLEAHDTHEEWITLATTWLCGAARKLREDDPDTQHAIADYLEAIADQARNISLIRKGLRDLDPSVSELSDVALS